MEQAGGALKMITMPLASLTDLINKKKSVADVSQKGGAGADAVWSADSILSLVTSLVFVALAAYLCWQCNAKEGVVLRSIYALIAGLFNSLYLIYYFIYHFLMGRAC